MNKRKKKFINLLLVIGILIIFSIPIFASETIDVKDYIKNRFPSIFSFYLSSLEDLDPYEKEFIDLLQELPEDKQEYYAKEVYKNGFSLELLKNVKEGKAIQVPASNLALPSLSNAKEKTIESLPALIKRINPSVVIVFAYDDKGEFLQLGSGFFISQNGDIITNYHVIQGASSAEIKTADEKTYPITYIVARDEQSDIIHLSVDISSKYVRPLSLSTTVPEVGEKIIVYGSPLGLEKTVSDGIVSAIREVPGYGKLIQITAPISPGSSGSPVLNMNGEVIGIATFQFIEGQNLNFAIPSERIANLSLTKENKASITEDLFEQESKLPSIFDIIKEEAEEAFKQTIRIDPDDSDTYHNMGVSYFKLDNYAKATEAFEQAIHINPYLAEAHFGLGRAFLMVGDKSLALDEYKVLKELDIDLANKLFDLIY
ncbi:hypothetical protein ES705_27958 [subsurface metagenome]